MAIKKLIEVALPLEAINSASAREKSIRHGHPSTLHLWWARRPLAAARAVIWSSLVDDPSSHPELFPTEEEQTKERQRLFAILEKLVKWENSNNEEILAEAKAEIMKSTNGNPPALFDPFAGGGTIPLEAQRLGLKAYASDLNPVAVMINKAMIEIPPRFAGMAPVNPEARASIGGSEAWSGAQGLAEDVRYYGQWMKDEAFKRIGHLYPKVIVPEEQGGGEATVIAWIWARTVKCPNPACGCEMPLASNFVLSKKKGKEAWVKPEVDHEHKRITYHVKNAGGEPPEAPKTARGAKFKCIMCSAAATPEYIKSEASADRMGACLMAIVAEGKKERIYLSPDSIQTAVANIPKPEDYPIGKLGDDRRAIWTPLYGLDTFDKLFTNRQLTALITFSGMVIEAQKRAEKDAATAGMHNDCIPLSEGGCGATAYGQAVGVYLSFLVDRMADRGSAICSWDVGYVKIRNTFGRQAIPMTWDYAEANPFSSSTGSYASMITWVVKVLLELPTFIKGYAEQFDAQSDIGLRNIAVSTDPPYYDNIGYADLSDFFYVWLRKSLKKTYPKLFRTMLVPKIEELVAIPYRFEGSMEKARDFFEDGMFATCRQIYKYSREDIPVTIYFAYKQSESREGESRKRIASPGWETMLTAIIQAGFVITGTWPMRTEMANRAIASGTNALASSIVLACRKRPENAPLCTRRNFINELKRELKPALQKLQRSNIAPVDLAQSAIGPGMAVYSRFSKVVEADGSPMGVRSALQIINQELDIFFNEQDGELDRDSRFCIDLYSQGAFNDIKFGDADILARAKNTSVATLASRGILYAQKGIVHLLGRDEIPTRVDSNEKTIWLLTQQLTRAMEKGGISSCAEIIAPMYGSNAEQAKSLAYRLFTIAERRGWAQEAYAYNALVIAWPEIQSRVAELHAIKPEQGTLFDTTENH